MMIPQKFMRMSCACSPLAGLWPIVLLQNTALVFVMRDGHIVKVAMGIEATKHF